MLSERGTETHPIPSVFLSPHGIDGRTTSPGSGEESAERGVREFERVGRQGDPA